MIILRKIALPPGNCTVVADTVSGTLDGSNKVFYTTYDYETDRIDLHLNGQALHSPNDFTQTGSNEITLIYDAPEADAVITATYETTACGGDISTYNHSELSGLDYASAGHTGFQPAGDYVTDAELVTFSGTIDHNTIVNTHNLTTDIDHNTITNYVVDEHRIINDSAASLTELWSANKIDSYIGTTQSGYLPLTLTSGTTVDVDGNILYIYDDADEVFRFGGDGVGYFKGFHTGNLVMQSASTGVRMGADGSDQTNYYGSGIYGYTSHILNISGNSIRFSTTSGIDFNSNKLYNISNLYLTSDRATVWSDSGGTQRGFLSVATPVDGNDAVTKDYVDGAITLISGSEADKIIDSVDSTSYIHATHVWTGTEYDYSHNVYIEDNLIGAWDSDGLTVTSGMSLTLGGTSYYSIPDVDRIEHVLDPTTYIYLHDDGGLPANYYQDFYIQGNKIMYLDSGGLTVGSGYSFTLDGISIEGFNTADAMQSRTTILPSEEVVWNYVDTVSGVLQTQIDGKSDIGHTHTESDITDLDKYTQAEVDDLIASASGTTDHSALDNLDYASAGHTGFASSAELATTSGTLQDQIDNITVSGGATTLLDLTDTPPSYSTHGGKYLSVKEDETGVEFVTESPTGSGVDTFIELTDTPTTYSGFEGYAVRVKDDGSGLEFVPDGCVILDGVESVPNGVYSVTVTFSGTVGTDYTVVTSLENTTDSPPSIYPNIITSKTSNSFTIDFAGSIDSANYKLNWRLWPSAQCLNIESVRDGAEIIPNGVNSLVVNFDFTLQSDQYALVLDLENGIDSDPSIYPVIITNKTTTGFEVAFSGDVDSSNYALNWVVVQPSAQCLNIESVYDGVEVIPNGVNFLVVDFDFILTSDQYALVLDLENEVDSDPSIYPIIITNRTTTGFEVSFSGDTDSSNYALNWVVWPSETCLNCDCELVDDTSPELGGDLEVGNHLALLSTTISGAYLHGYTVGWSSTDASEMTVQRNDTGFGCPFYMNTNGQLFQCTAASGTTQMPCVALAVEEGTGSNKKIMWSGIVRKDAWTWTPGDTIYVSTVAGALTSAKPTGGGDWVQAIGVALKSNVIRFSSGFNPGYLNS